MTSEIVTSALVAALEFAGKTGATEAMKKAVADGYEVVKSHILNKYTDEHELAGAIAQLEAKPASEGRRQMLTEELASRAVG